MRKYVLTSIAVLPLLLSFSHAAQNWSVDPPATSFGFSSEESGTSAYLGVDITDVTTDRLGALKLKEEKGVEVTMVDQDAPAGKAGVKEHDVILSMNGTPIESGVQIKRMIHETPAGRLVTLELSRDGQPLTIKVQLAERRKQFAWVDPKVNVHVDVPPIPPMPNFPNVEIPGVNVVVVHSSLRSGLMVENITPQLGEFFGVKNGNGVLIRSVEKGSRADKAGFHAGDVVVKVNDQPVHDTSDFMHVLRSRSGAVSVGVVRDKKEQNLNLPLPERKDSGSLIEESLEAPEIDAETQLELSEARKELAELQPEMVLAAEAMGDVSVSLSKQFFEQQKQFREQAKKFQNEFKPQMQRKFKREQEEMKRDLERLREEMRGSGLDI